MSLGDRDSYYEEFETNNLPKGENKIKSKLLGNESELEFYWWENKHLHFCEIRNYSCLYTISISMIFA